MGLKYYIEFWHTYTIDKPDKLGLLGWDDKEKKYIVVGKDQKSQERIQHLYQEVLDGRESGAKLKKAKNKPSDYLNIISEHYINSSIFSISDVKQGEVKNRGG